MTNLHPDDVVAFTTGAEPPPAPVPDGLPRAELARSRAAAEVGRWATRAELLLFQFEHRAPVDADGDPGGDDGDPGDRDGGWTDGVLPEPKYGAFRHDLRIGSFHPGHRAKWTAHELCHGLVGFAWRADASPLFHATAARLAELAPVVLWYFLDEIGLRRCPRHVGPLFRGLCADCERLAAEGPGIHDVAAAARFAADAARFVDDELAAVARTLRLGRPAPHVWGSIDLCGDGLAYAAAHAPRLRGPAFAAWAERFLGLGDPMWHSSLDGLAERAVAVLRAIGQGEALPVAGTRAGWVAQDLGQRLLDVWGLTEGDCADALLAVVDDLADGASPADTFAAYAELYAAYELPDPADVFAVGYAVDGVPCRASAQIADGLATVVPVTLDAARDAGLDPVADLAAPFVAADRLVRRPLGHRFADWLAVAHPGPIADLARYEAALRSARGEPAAVALGAGVGSRLADGFEVHRFAVDVVALADAVEAGEATGVVVDGALTVAGVDGEPVEAEPTALAIGRCGADLVIASVDPGWALTAPDTLPDDTRRILTEAGVLVADRWTAR